MLGSVTGSRGSSPLTALQPFAFLSPPPYLFFFLNKKTYQHACRNRPDLQIDNVFARSISPLRLTPRIWEAPAFGVR